ncbi:hypothetical protein [Nostoc sp.]|uniref:hypothetical protein n=1 Tax=Nostoc sp. TaxID=1180 RepID=UPI002FF5C386
MVRKGDRFYIYSNGGTSKSLNEEILEDEAAIALTSLPSRVSKVAPTCYESAT